MKKIYPNIKLWQGLTLTSNWILLLVLFAFSCSKNLEQLPTDILKTNSTNDGSKVKSAMADINIDTLNSLRQDAAFRHLVYLWSTQRNIKTSDSLRNIATDSLHFRSLLIELIRRDSKAIIEYSRKRYGEAGHENKIIDYINYENYGAPKTKCFDDFLACEDCVVYEPTIFYKNVTSITNVMHQYSYMYQCDYSRGTGKSFFWLNYTRVTIAKAPSMYYRKVLEYIAKGSFNFEDYYIGPAPYPGFNPEYFNWNTLLAYIRLYSEDNIFLAHDMCPPSNHGGGDNTGGGSGGGGTTYPPTNPDPDPEPQQECSHVICSECKLPIEVNGFILRSIPSCGHSGSCKCWWGSGHNKLMEEGIGQYLTEEQLIAVKNGSSEADERPYQGLKYAHYHAMVEKGKTPEEAKVEMRNHFITTITAYKTLNDYRSLGFALHMIQDIYSPAHSLKNWDGKTISYVPHIFEGRVFNKPEFNDALRATKYIYRQICDCESNSESLGALFDSWLTNYEKQYVQ